MKNEENKESYLISIGIGPVQDFIASARRCRDLWFGSWLLSELSKTVARTIVEEKGKLIFPNTCKHNLNKNTDFNVVNKILAVVDGNPINSNLNNKLEDAIDLRLAEIKKLAFKNFKNQFVEIEKANLQISDLVELYWSAVKHKNTKDYIEDRKKVERLFSARKSTRNFEQVILWSSDKEKGWSGNVPKSSLDGQRESCIKEYVYDDLSKEELRIHLGVKEGERLCGIGLLKRHGNRAGEDSFFSTSHVASLPLLERLNKQEETQRTKNYIETIKYLLKEPGVVNDEDLYKIVGRVPNNLSDCIFGRYDGHLLFTERLKEFFSDENKLNDAKNELRNFLDQVLGKNKLPLPYYALLLADGDFMGKAINEQDANEQNAMKKHRQLSAKLSEFTSNVKTIIEGEKLGSLIYSGGDDVLAFVGLHKVLECAKRLSKVFAEKLQNYSYDGEKSPTLSVGIAIVHHLEPLEDALELVRKTEKAAKSVKDKNALAIIVDKRSGSSRIAKGKWGDMDERLKTFIALHRNEAIPDGAAYELRDLANHLEIPENATEELKNNLILAKEKEAKRILQRKKKDLGKNYVDNVVIKKIGQFINDIEKEKDTDEDSISILADELIIAKIFADAEDMALAEVTE